MEFDITGNLKLNTQQATQQMDNFMGGLNSMPPMIGDNQTPSIMQTAQQKTTESANQLNESFGDLQDQMKNVLESFKALCIQMDKTASTAGVDWTKPRKDGNANLPTVSNGNAVTNQVKGVVGVVDNASNMVTTVANGNIGGAVISGVNTTGSAILQGASKAGLAGMGGLAAGLGIAGGVLLAGGAALKGGNALSEKYEDALPGLEKLLTNYGFNVSGNSRQVNAAQALSLRKKTLEASLGTGMEYENFIGLTNSLGQYGINNIDVATGIARQSALLGAYTNTDASKIASFGGLMQRYGADGSVAIQNAYGAARASGLERNQFGEFLDGLQRVVENGISKGFIQSSDEVSTNLGMLAKLSDNNALWQGQDGANRYMTMMNTASSKTDLASTTSILMARAATDLGEDAIKKVLTKGGEESGNYLEGSSMLNTLAYMEQGGMSADFMKSFRDRLKNTFNGDVDSQVGAIKEAYGLNYAGSIQLYNMMQKIGTDGYSDTEFEEEANALKDSGKYDSDNKKLTDILTSINSQVVEIGKKTFDIKVGTLQGVEGILNKIYGFMIKDSYSNSIKSASKGFFDNGEKTKSKFMDQVYQDLASGDASKIQNIFDMINFMENADEATKNYFNRNNVEMSLFDSEKRQLHSDYKSWIDGDKQEPDFNINSGYGKAIDAMDLYGELADSENITTQAEKDMQYIWYGLNDPKIVKIIGEKKSEENKQQLLEYANANLTGGGPNVKGGYTFDDNLGSDIAELKSFVSKIVANNKNITINIPDYYTSSYLGK